jgi:type IV secretory pathway TraG/TraD family ATPase VirD4
MFGEEPVLEQPAGTSTSENTSEHVVAQPLMSPDEIRKMHPQKCIVIRHGDPVLCWRVDYYSDKTFSAWTRPDPKYAK